MLNDFGLIGKSLSQKTCLELLHFIEGDSQNYFDQLYKRKDIIKCFGRHLICYKDKFVVNVSINQNHKIISINLIGPYTLKYL